MNKKYFKTIDMATIILFSPLYAILNLYIGPLGFALLKLPVLCDVAVFFTLLLVVWLSAKFGSASIVGLIGSLIVLSLRPSPHIIGFAAASVLFDILMAVNRHKISLNTYSMASAAIVTAISAYFAGALIGAFFMEKPLSSATLQWALTLWGGWHLIGGIASLAIAFPIMAILERANVKRIKSV
jgi:hypothetical protein